MMNHSLLVRDVWCLAMRRSIDSYALDASDLPLTTFKRASQAGNMNHDLPILVART